MNNDASMQSGFSEIQNFILTLTREEEEDLKNLYLTDSLKGYTTEAKGYKLLTASQEVELSKKILEEDDASARNELVTHNLRLVIHMAHKYSWSTIPLNDLVQEGNIGLMKAADKFDYKKGFRFTTYAVWWIRQAIGRAIDSQSHTIRPPFHIQALIKKIRRVSNDIRKETGQAACVKDIAIRIGISELEVQKTICLADIQVVSLDQVTQIVQHGGESDGPSLSESLSDTQTLNNDLFIGAQDELRTSSERIEETLRVIRNNDRITTKKREVFELVYKLEEGECYTFEHVAGQVGVSRERVRQIITEIWNKVGKCYNVCHNHTDFMRTLHSVEELQKLVDAVVNARRVLIRPPK